MNNPSTEEIRKLLNESKTIAVVGLSDKPHRASFGVSKYLQDQGYKILPVHPRVKEVLGEKVYRSLSEIPDQPIDIADLFIRSELVPPVVDEAIQKGVKAIWMQEGVVHEEAAKKARAAGLIVVQDRCIYKEHLR